MLLAGDWGSKQTPSSAVVVFAVNLEQTTHESMLLEAVFFAAGKPSVLLDVERAPEQVVVLIGKLLFDHLLVGKHRCKISITTAKQQAPQTRCNDLRDRVAT